MATIFVKLSFIVEELINGDSFLRLITLNFTNSCDECYQKEHLLRIFIIIFLPAAQNVLLENFKHNIATIFEVLHLTPTYNEVI